MDRMKQELGINQQAELVGRGGIDEGVADRAVVRLLVVLLAEQLDVGQRVGRVLRVEHQRFGFRLHLFDFRRDAILRRAVRHRVKRGLQVVGVGLFGQHVQKVLADQLGVDAHEQRRNAFGDEIPAVGEGIEEAAQAGILGGFPVLGVHANVYDGSYHEVDSSEMAFHIAGSMAFKEAMAKASPVLLEPIMKVEVTMPEEYMGDVIGDINSRRGRIEGMDDIGGGKMVKAYVPLAEMFGYSTDLRSKTQGRGNYSMFFEKYEPVPKSVQEKVLADKSK